MDNFLENIGPGESIKKGIEVGKTTIFRYNRPVRFQLEMANGSVIEGIIPANAEFKITPQPSDITRFDVFIEDLPSAPQIVV